MQAGHHPQAAASLRTRRSAVALGHSVTQTGTPQHVPSAPNCTIHTGNRQARIAAAAGAARHVDSTTHRDRYQPDEPRREHPGCPMSRLACSRLRSGADCQMHGDPTYLMQKRTFVPKAVVHEHTARPSAHRAVYGTAGRPTRPTPASRDNHVGRRGRVGRHGQDGGKTAAPAHGDRDLSTGRAAYVTVWTCAGAG